MPAVIRCFLSRSSTDPLAAPVAADLVARLPGLVFEVSGRQLEVFDCGAVPWGSPVQDTVRRELKRADVFLPLVSRAYLADEECRKQVRKARVPFVPVSLLASGVADSDDEVADALAAWSGAEAADVEKLAGLVWERTRLTGLVRGAVANGRAAALIATIEDVAMQRGHHARLAPLLAALEQRVERLR